MHGITLPGLPKYAKAIVSLFLVVLGLAYLVGVLNIYEKTRFTTQGVVENYRGSEEKMIYAKELGDMVSTTHFHVGGWAMMFMFVLGIFMFSSYSARLKGAIGWLPFVFVPLDAACMWLVRYVSPGFAAVFIVVGSTMATLYGLFIVLNLFNIWFGKPSLRTT